MADTQNSLLTETYREFLDEATETDQSNSHGRTTRTRIRDRVVAGIGDFEYLAEPALFSEQDAEMVAEKLSIDHLEELIAFVYRMAPEAIEQIVREGIEKGVARVDPEYRVNEVSIDIRPRRRVLDQAHQKLDSEEPLSPVELIELLQDEDTSPTEVAEHVSSFPHRTTAEYTRRIR